jgi:hypothetical protein
VKQLHGAENAALDLRSTQALRRVQDALDAAGVGQGMSRDTAPLVARQELDSALKAGRQQESTLWNAIDPEGSLAFSTAPLQSDINNYVLRVRRQIDPIFHRT